jgi:Zn-dependent protease
MQLSLIIVIFQVSVLVFSAIIHEYMHGWMADRLGDPTAKDEGRLTLNPIPHIDPLGSILLPLLLVATGSGIVFGWAKPVPYNPYNLKDKKYGSAKVAVAGPLGNLIIALLFGLTLRFLPMELSQTTVGLFQIIIFINVLLMIFNLVPIPPLDGSKVIAPFLPVNLQIQMAKLEPYGMFLVILFLWIGLPLIVPIINLVFNIITGIG